MGKRIIIGIITGIVIIGALLFYFVKENEPAVDSIYKAVPLDVALIIDVKNFNEFQNNLILDNPLWNELSKITLFREFNAQLRMVDSIRKSNQILDKLLVQNRSILITGHPSGKDDIQFIYYLKVNSEKDFRQIDKLIQSFENNTVDISSHTYEHTTIRDISFTEKKSKNFSYTWTHGLMVLSRSSIMVEDAVRQLLATESILQQKGLNEIVKTAGKNAMANFYLNFQYLPRIGLKAIHPKFRREMDFIKKFGNWLELDLNLKTDMLILNGFAYSDGTYPGFEALFRDQKPQKIEMFNVIPAQTCAFAALGISNIDLYLKNYLSFLESQSNNTSIKSDLKAIKDAYTIDLRESFKEIFEKEAGVVFINDAGDTLANQAFSIIRTKNKDDAESLLNSYISDYSAKNDVQTLDFVLEREVNADSKLKIWKIPFGNIPAVLFGKLFSANNNTYCTFNNNYLIFGNSPDALVRYAQKLSERPSLGSDLEFSNFSDYLASQSNFFFYNKPSLSTNFYPFFLKQDIIYSIALQHEYFNRMQALVYQFNTGDHGLIYNNIFVKYSSGTSDQTDSRTTWETPLDGDIVGKPLILKSSDNKSLDIFVQDSKNQIYLVNNLGRILWRNKLTEPIISDIYPIDYYKNGKQQLLFNTRTYLYIIDKKGNAVERSPILLQTAATNGLAVFDYEKNRNYRIFIAGADRKIYAYDREGKSIDGWNFDATESNVTKPLQHFRIEGKDFLVFNDNDNLYILDRKGNIVKKTDRKFSISVNNVTSLVNSKSLKEARFVLTGPSGKVYFVGLDGSVKESDFGSFPENHWFNLCDLNADGIKDLVFAWDNKVKAVTQKNTTLFELTLDRNIGFRPAFFEFSTNKFNLGLVSPDYEKIYLYDNAGNLCKSFPLKGNTQFSVELFNNSENRFNLIVGSNHNFLYQYSVQ